MIADMKHSVTADESSNDVMTFALENIGNSRHITHNNFVNEAFEKDAGNIQIKPSSADVDHFTVPPIAIPGNQGINETTNGNKETKKKEKEFTYGCFCIRSKFMQKIFNRPLFFVLMLCLGAFTQGFVVTGITFSSITSLEKQFGLKSTEPGLYSTSYDAAYGICCLFVGYFGHVHKPKWIGLGMILMTVASFIYTLPKYMYGSYIAKLDIVQDVCNITNTDELNCEGETHWYYRFFFFLANIFLGIGAIPLATLGTAHIYEVTEAAKSGIYMAFFYASAVVGPGIGFIIMLPVLNTWVDIEKPPDSRLTPEDNNWVGAWWLGYLLGCLLLFLPALPMLGFPRQFSNTETLQMKKKELKDTVVSDKKLNHDIKSLWPATKTLLKNKTFVFICLAGATESFASAGFSTFISKFIETQFHFTSSNSALYTGIIILPGAALGCLVGGAMILKNPNWTCKKTLRVSTIIGFVSIIPILSILVGCNARDVVGSKNDMTPLYSENNSLLAACNADCNCNTRYYKPICSVAEQRTFFSRCYAGCTADNLVNGKLWNCSCISNTTYAVDGRCTVDCNLFPLFAVGCFLLIAVGFLNNVPILYSVFRVVPDGQGSFAMGFQQLFIRFLGFIPAPTLFGKIIDLSCNLWHPDHCETGETRNCLEYDNPKFRLYLFILGASTKVLTAIFVLLAYLYYKRPQKKNIEREAVITINRQTSQVAIIPIVSS